jgi:DNA mismatch repair ATPase MutS
VSLFENVGKSLNFGYTSDTVLFELRKAYESKRTMMLDLISDYNIKILDTNQKITDLENLYIDEVIIPEKYRYDSVHIASTTFNNLDCLLTFMLLTTKVVCFLLPEFVHFLL